MKLDIKYVSIIVLSFIIVVYSMYNSKLKLENKIYDKQKEIKILEQDNDSLGIHIKKTLSSNDSNNKKIDLLEHELIIANTTIVILRDSITKSNKLDTIYTFIDSIKTMNYIVEDSLDLKNDGKVVTKVDLEIDSNRVAKHANFTWSYKSPSVIIESGIIFNSDSKLLRSYALVNGIRHEATTNMYSKLYDSFYNSFIEPKKENLPFEWYDRISTGVGVSYLYNGKVLPSVYIGYSFTIREFKKLIK